MYNEKGDAGSGCIPFLSLVESQFIQSSGA